MLLAAGCGGSSSGDATSATVDLSLGSHTARLAVVGDIACASPTPIGDRCHQAATYKVAAKMKPDRVLVIGDTQYPDGSLRLYKKSYAKSWGKLKPITFPVPGNHEYETPGAAGYFDYFGAAAANRKQGWHASTTRSAAARLDHRSRNGSRTTSGRTPNAARWQSGTTRASAPARTATTRTSPISGRSSTTLRLRSCSPVMTTITSASGQ